ncbi:MAG: hypothetical protein ABSG50_08165 [Opitutaceae bacterium]|jgi:hypothetical protein
MPPRGALVLVDAVAIKAAHQLGCWNALRKTYRLETVEKCVEEASRLDRSGRRLVNREAAEIKAEIETRPVTAVQRAAVRLKVGSRVDLDDGELDLLAYALTLERQPWWLCGPDKATLIALSRLQLLERMVSLEALASGVGHKVREWEEQYTEKWLSAKRLKLQLGDELI